MTTIVAATSVAGFEAITLENDRLRAVVMPTLGAKVWELEDKERQRQWIWHRGDVPLEASPAGTPYDDAWPGVAVDPRFGTSIKRGEPFGWPVGQDTDLRLIPPRTARAQEFVYVHDLAGDWCGVDDLRNGASLRMRFDTRSFPYVWLFLTYGGWRNLYTAVLEPCTNMPKDLAEAVRLKQSARLEPGAEFATTVAVTLGGLPQ